MQHNPYQAPQTQDLHAPDAEYEYAGFWIRVLASIGNSLLLFVALTPIIFALAMAGLIDFDKPFGLGDILTQIATAFFYIWLWVKYAGTPVKRLLKLKVLDAKSGVHLTYKQAIVRYLGYIPSGLILCLGFIWVAFDSKKQGWHDKMAGSVVVKELN